MDLTKLRHIVMFGFKGGTSDAEIDEIARRFGALADAVPGIEAFEWGANNSPEGRYRNLTSGNLVCAGSARLCRGMPRQRRPILIFHGAAKPTMEKREWTIGRIRRSRPSWNI